MVALASVSAEAAEVAPPPAPLAVDAAFATVASFEAGKFVVRFDVLPGHYLYRDRFEMQANGQAVAKIDSPPGKIKLDPTFGRVEVYEQPLSVTAATKLKEATELKLDIGLERHPVRIADPVRDVFGHHRRTERKGKLLRVGNSSRHCDGQKAGKENSGHAVPPFDGRASTFLPWHSSMPHDLAGHSRTKFD